MALPQWKLPTRIEPGTVEPLLRAMREAKSRADIQKAIAALEALGPAVIPEIRKNPAWFPQSNAFEADLASFEKRLACVVTEITFTKDPLVPDAGLGAVMGGLTHVPLTAEKFISVPLCVAKGWRNHSLGILLRAVRDEDLGGVSMQVSVTTNRAAQAGSQKGWNWLGRVTVGTESIHSSAGSSSAEYGATLECYEDLVSAINQAINASPEVPFIINFSMLREE